jgi:hypothetical protein
MQQGAALGNSTSHNSRGSPSPRFGTIGISPIRGGGNTDSQLGAASLQRFQSQVTQYD